MFTESNNGIKHNNCNSFQSIFTVLKEWTPAQFDKYVYLTCTLNGVQFMHSSYKRVGVRQREALKIHTHHALFASNYPHTYSYTYTSMYIHKLGVRLHRAPFGIDTQFNNNEWRECFIDILHIVSMYVYLHIQGILESNENGRCKWRRKK